MRYGSNIDPPNPFDRHQREKDLEHVADDLDYLASLELFHSHIERGISPIKLLFCKRSFISPSKFPISFGIFPLNPQSYS